MSNGLKVVLLENHTVPVIDLQVWYHVGGKDEQPGRTGFAHLFEHLMFKGSAHVGPDEHSRIVEAVGGFDKRGNRRRHHELFRNFPKQLPSNECCGWKRTGWAASMWMRRTSSPSGKVVEEERRVRVDNQPYGTLEEDLRAVAFTTHGYHHTPIGSIQDLENAQRSGRARFLQYLLQAEQRHAGDCG